MKLTKKKILFTVLELIFTCGIPLALIIFQYSNIGHTGKAVGFKLSVTGIFLIITVFLILKKCVLNKRIEAMRFRINSHAALLETETDKGKIENACSALKGLRTAETLFGAVLPTLFLSALIVCCKALESQLIHLTGTVGLILVSFIFGTVFAVLSARQVTIKQKKTKKDKGVSVE